MGRGRYDGQIDFFAPFAPADGTFLELGCATGALASVTRERLTPKRFDGVEMSPAREIAKSHMDNIYEEPLSVLVERGELHGSYDLILMSHVLEHLDDPAAEIRAMAKALATNGRIFIEVPNQSGHPRLPIDDNRFHIHFFSPASLSRLLALEGFNVIAMRTGVRLDARCTDAMQVVAQRFSIPVWSQSMISDHPDLGGDQEIVVWAAGGTANALLANFFDLSRIAFFVDRDVAKQGGLCLGRPILSPDVIGQEPRTILINSIDFVDAIAADIERRYPHAGHKVVRIGDLL
jgi:trans-aconitate methyltransferase